jgi:hypothetical protein
MDTAYNQHSNPARRKNRSTTNLNHLSLAPLTSKLPIHDQDEIPEPATAPLRTPRSYLQGKSAPTTPGLLTRSPTGRSRSRGRSTRAALAAAAAAADQIPKSKSTTHLGAASRGHSRCHSGTGGSGTATPSTRRRHRDDGNGFPARDRNDSDWLLRTGVMISTETRESKGQAWLVSRASSTSLAARDDDDEEEGAAVNQEARRDTFGNAMGADEGDLVDSAQSSRFGSRTHSRGQVLTPGERRQLDDYFGSQGEFREEGSGIPGPDFVNLDERLEAIDRDTTEEDEAHVQKLVKRGPLGHGTWLGSMLPWSLWSVQERDEETDDPEDGAPSTEDGDEGSGFTLKRSQSTASCHLRDLTAIQEERPPPPGDGEDGWQDAAWLLSVASKVLL